MGLFACSGPDAPAVIGQNIEIGYVNAEVTGGLIVVSLLALAIRPRRWIVPAALVVLLALHPAWTISAISGDCGFLKRDMSYLFTAVGCAALFWQVGRLVWSRIRFPSSPASPPDR